MQNIESDFLSIKEFASKVGVHSNTVRRCIQKGKISAINMGSGKKAIYRIAKSEINRIALFDMEQMIIKIIEKRGLNSPKVL
jgi:excisionase family DNA binding protein